MILQPSSGRRILKSITNYEMLDHFDPDSFGGVVLDESSILKNCMGKVRTQIIEMFRNVPYRLSCTATPSPNDYMELGNQVEFLGIMSRTEMLATYFPLRPDLCQSGGVLRERGSAGYF